MFGAFRAVLDIVRNERVDVVCFGEVYSLGWLGVLLRKLKGVPCIHYIHGEEITAGVSSRLYGRGALSALRKAEAVVVVSEFTRREVIRRGVPADHVHLISNGVDLELFSPGPRDPAIMSKHCLEGKTVMLTVGRLEPRKGHDTVIKALPEILKEVPELVYVIVGAGSDDKRLRGLAEAVDVKDKVIFAGRVPNDELIGYYRTVDLFIMPNRTLEDGDTEGFGLVFLEANACGKPVIGGNAGGVPDAVVDGETGLLVDGKSVKAVADAAARILRNPELAERLGEAGRRRALTFGWAIKAKEFRTLCERLALK
jgi:phosphatidylinositol alpha-1,6-mannosyltransferase